MDYGVYQTLEDLTLASNAFASFVSASIGLLPPIFRNALPCRVLQANADLLTHSHLSHARPDFGIDAVSVDGEQVEVTPRVVGATPFGGLVHFAKDVRQEQPRVLLVAPLSGHYATLLRETVRTLLADHDVYLTDWYNARDIPLIAGPFGFDDYVAQLTRFIRRIGEDVHVIAVCQPAVPALAATALLAQSVDRFEIRTLILMAGPVDARIHPTQVDDLAQSRPIEWFEENLLATVPYRFLGAGRRVYPGVMQISAFLSMNIARHLQAHIEMWGNLARGERADAASTRRFYDEYFAVLDLPGEFYLETVQRVFQQHELARGVMKVAGETVDPSSIRRTALLTIEGERDDICAPGQTAAAHELCANVEPSRRGTHVQPGVGHYGVFSGSRWVREVYPRVRSFILANR